MHSTLLVLLGSFIGGLVGFVFGLLYLALLIGGIYGSWKTFEKAAKPGWACLIPIYNIVILHEIVGRNLIKLLLLFIPFVNIYFIITLYISLAKSFGKRDTGDYILAIFFWPFTLGLGNAQYVGPSEGPATTSNGFSTPPSTYQPPFAPSK